MRNEGGGRRRRWLRPGRADGGGRPRRRSRGARHLSGADAGQPVHRPAVALQGAPPGDGQARARRGRTGRAAGSRLALGDELLLAPTGGRGSRRRPQRLSGSLARDNGPRRRPESGALGVICGQRTGASWPCAAAPDAASMAPPALWRLAMPARRRAVCRSGAAAGRRAVPPRFTLADAERVAAEAETLAGRSLGVTAGKARGTLTPAIMRPWMRAYPSGLRPPYVVSADQQAVRRRLARSSPVPATRRSMPASARRREASCFVPSRTGTACCAPEAVALVDRRPATARRSAAVSCSSLSRCVPTARWRPRQSSSASRRSWRRSPPTIRRASPAWRTSTRWPTTCAAR